MTVTSALVTFVSRFALQVSLISVSTVSIKALPGCLHWDLFLALANCNARRAWCGRELCWWRLALQGCFWSAVVQQDYL